MRSKRALLIAILMAVGSVILMYSYSERKIGIYAKRYKQEAVIIASKDIFQSSLIDESMLEIKWIPRPYIEPNAVKVSERVIGYLAAINIIKGEQITDQKLARLGASASSEVLKGKRAYTIAINEITGVAGLIKKGDHVDIIGIFKTLDPQIKTVGDAEAVTIMQDVQVLAVGRNYMLESLPSGGDLGGASKSTDLNFSNITLLLTPRQCMDLALAQEVGNLSLALRPKNDFEPAKTPETLKTNRSTPISVTGIKKKLDIAPGPRWMEQRGDRSIWVR